MQCEKRSVFISAALNETADPGNDRFTQLLTCSFCCPDFPVWLCWSGLLSGQSGFCLWHSKAFPVTPRWLGKQLESIWDAKHKYFRYSRCKKGGKIERVKEDGRVGANSGTVWSPRLEEVTSCKWISSQSQLLASLFTRQFVLNQKVNYIGNRVLH